MNGGTDYLIKAAATFCCVVFAGRSAPADSANSTVRSLAAGCAACHGTDGHAVAGPPMLRLSGLPKAEFLRRMRAFRDGTGEATVMRQIAKGYSVEQMDALGDYFAAQR
jgi:cytochrome c553